MQNMWLGCQKRSGRESMIILDSLMVFSLECCSVKASRCDNVFCFRTYIIFGEQLPSCDMAQPTCSPPKCPCAQEFRPEDKLKALRSISHLIFITCMHMRQMVGRLAALMVTPGDTWSPKSSYVQLRPAVRLLQGDFTQRRSFRDIFPAGC